MSTPTDTQTEVGFPSPYDQAIPPCLQQSAPALDWGLDTPAAKARVEEIQEATRFWVDSLLSATQPLHMKKIVLRWLGDHATAVAELPGIIPGLMRVQAQHRMQGSVADLLKKLDRVKRQVEAARAKLDADIADDEDPDAPAHPAVVAVMAEVPGNRQLPPQLSWRGPRLTSGATTVAMLPIVLSGRARDVHTGACTTRLTWATDRMGATTSRWIPASQATSARGLHALTDAGAPCPEASAGALGVALEAMRTSWDLPEQATSSKCGHVTVGDGRAFCLGDTVVAAGDAPPIVMQPPDGHVTLMASIRQSGDLETWMGAWATAARSPLARCIVYAALASPLLPWTSKAGAVIDLHGRTTQGKTTVLLLAASLFASPLEYTQKWASTLTYRERVASILCHLPLAVDDSKQIGKFEKDQIGGAIYTLADGQGKGRGTVAGTQNRAAWQLITISTGEAPLLATTQDEGARGRCLSLGGAPLHSGEDATAIFGIVTKNFGVFGPVFIQRMMDIGERAIRSAYEKIHADILARLDVASGGAASPVARRLGATIAVMRLAAIIAHSCGLSGEDGMEEAIATAMRGAITTGADADRAREAMQMVLTRCAQQGGQFFGRHPVGTEQPSGGWLGKWDRGDEYEYIAVATTTIKKWLQDDGYDVASTMAVWTDRQWITCDPGRQDTTRRINGAKMRVILIVGDAARDLLGGE